MFKLHPCEPMRLQRLSLIIEGYIINELITLNQSGCSKFVMYIMIFKIPCCCVLFIRWSSKKMMMIRDVVLQSRRKEKQL